jgi:hypothetical protein
VKAERKLTVGTLPIDSSAVVTLVSNIYVESRVSLRQSVSRYGLVSSPLCGCLTRYCFLFKSFGLEFVVLSLWGALSDERLGLFFVSHSLVICLCVHLLFTFLSFTHLSYTYCNVHIHI